MKTHQVLLILFLLQLSVFVSHSAPTPTHKQNKKNLTLKRDHSDDSAELSEL